MFGPLNNRHVGSRRGLRAFFDMRALQFGSLNFFDKSCYSLHAVYTEGFEHVDKLKVPPINEVVCGILFQPIQKFTLFQHGVFWANRRNDFPTFELKPLIVDPGAPLTIPIELATRTWMVSKDITLLTQLQFDRFFVNWRKQKPSDVYPRFSSRSNEDRGLLDTTLKEFEELRHFLRGLQVDVQPHAVELTKVDILFEGDHWSDAIDLKRLLPVTQGLVELNGDAFPVGASLNSERTVSNVRVRTVIGFTSVLATGKGAVRIETTARIDSTHELTRASLERANAAVNDAFARLLPDRTRFNAETI